MDAKVNNQQHGGSVQSRLWSGAQPERRELVVLCRRLTVVFLAWLCFAGHGHIMLAAPPDAATTLEYKVKAGFLFQFFKFVEWPEAKHDSSSGPLVVGVVDRAAAAAIIEEVFRHKSVSGRPLVVKQLTAADDPGQCHIVFISRAEQAQVPAVLAAIDNAAVLTVGEVDRFAHQGGRINFVMKEHTVRLEINLEAAQQAGLKISSKLASISTIVKPPKGRPAS